MGVQNAFDILGSYWTLAGDVNPSSSDPSPKWSPLDFRERVETAADVGFRGMGFWHADLEHLRESRSLPELGSILQDSGIDLIELEFAEYALLDPSHPQHADGDERIELFRETARAWDARHIKIGNRVRTEMAVSHVRELMESFCERVAADDLQVGIEFVAGDPAIGDIDELVAAIPEAENGGVILDPWHLVWEDIPFEEVREIPVDDIVNVELNDGFYGLDLGRSIETTQHRALPGEGEFDVVEFVEILMDMGYDGPWGVEVLSEKLRTLPIDELYARSYEQTRAVLEKAN